MPCKLTERELQGASSGFIELSDQNALLLKQNRDAVTDRVGQPIVFRDQRLLELVSDECIITLNQAPGLNPRIQHMQRRIRHQLQRRMRRRAADDVEQFTVETHFL